MIKLSKTISYVNWDKLIERNPVTTHAFVPRKPVKVEDGVRPYDLEWDQSSAHIAVLAKEACLPLTLDGKLITCVERAVAYSPSSFIPPRPFFVRHRVANKHPAFRDACRQGLIVMNDYEISNIKVDFLEGQLATGGNAHYGSQVQDWFRFMEPVWAGELIGANAPKGRPSASLKWCMNTKLGWHESSRVTVPFGKETFESRWCSPTAVEPIVRNLSRFRGLDSVLIQQNTANANGGDVDVLTALAEMPELVESIVDGLALLKKGSKAARAKEIVLTAQSKRRANLRRQILFSKTMKFPSLKSYVRRGGKPEDYHRDRDLFRTYKGLRERERRQLYRNTVRKDAKELGDAITGVWLNFRYNIMPTVYMIEDTIKALDRAYSIYKTTRGISSRQEASPELGSFNFVGSISITDRVTTKRHYKVELGDSFKGGFRAAFGFDILVTALERVPLWGIVVNWFVTAADLLRALPWDPKHTQSLTCFSQKITIKGRLYEGPIDESSPSVAVDGSAYYRYVINPNEHLGLYVNLNINLFRKIDALAFFWSKDRKTYLTR